MENEKPKDGFGSAAFGGKNFPKLFVRRDIEFYSKAIEAKTVPDHEFCVEYMPEHDSVAIAKRLEAALSAEKQRALKAVEEAIREFTAQILHGDAPHRAWLVDASEKFIESRAAKEPS